MHNDFTTIIYVCEQNIECDFVDAILTLNTFVMGKVRYERIDVIGCGNIRVLIRCLTN